MPRAPARIRRRRCRRCRRSPAPAGVVELSGDSDPAPTAEARAQAVGQSREELQKRRDAILKGPGAAQVQPLRLDEKLQLKSDDLKLGPMPTLPKIDGMQKFM